MFNRKYFEHFDWLLLLTVYTLNVLGVLTIYSATFSDPSPDYRKQIYWIGASTVVLIFTLLIDYQTIIKYSWAFYSATLLGLIVVLFMPVYLGVHRWLFIPGIHYKLQPSEFAKLTLILILSFWGSRRRGAEPKFKDLIVPSLLTGIPFLLIVKEPDLGTALILMPLLVAIVFTSGFSIKKMLLIALVIIVPAVILAPHILKPYQMKRITSFLHPEDDPLGSGYHLIQSQIAIGSGGLMGKGFKSGTQSHLDFLPVQDTDFIFAVWGEERGFIGSLVLLSLYFLFLYRTLRIARLSKDLAGSYLCVGFAVMIFCQIIINSGMVIGLMPITGLPLPFMSYGGSASLTNFFSVGMILNVSMRKFPDYKI